MTYFEPPEGIVALCVLSVEEACCLGRRVEHVFRRQALCLRDVADLVVLGRPWIQRPAKEQLSDDAAK